MEARLADRIMQSGLKPHEFPLANDRSLLLVEDDKVFLHQLARALEGQGFRTKSVSTVGEAMRYVAAFPPAFAVVDLRLEDGSGLEVVIALRQRRPEARSIVLTGYGSIASAVAAVKLGAHDYLSKPVDVSEIVASLLAIKGDESKLPERPMSPDRVRWEHILRIYELCDHNVTDTARCLQMHRRTLQRILAKHAPQ